MAKLKLFGFSFLILFLELALIRFIPGNLRLFSYFGNLVLIASFLGIGFGFLLSRSKWNLTPLFPLSITGLLAIVINSKVSIGRVASGTTFFSFLSNEQLKIESVGSLVLIFVLVTITLAFLSQSAGKLFPKFKPLTAYSIDIAGSVLGVVIFSLISFFSVPAIWWFLIAFVVYLILVFPNR